MNYPAVLDQLYDVPVETFQHGSPIYAIILGAIAAAMTRFTNSSEALIPSNLNLTSAQWGWLNAIGELYGILRNQYEIDPSYRNRIQTMLVAPHGTPLAMQQFIYKITGIQVIVTENLSTGGYQLNFNGPVSQATLQLVVMSMAWVRPAGVPFLPLYTQSGGLYLNTCNFIGVQYVTGSYLSNPVISVNISIGEGTDNPMNNLPTLYLSDQYLTGQFVPQKQI